jgi:hypothetical protein
MPRRLLVADDALIIRQIIKDMADRRRLGGGGRGQPTARRRSTVIGNCTPMP